MKKLLVALLPGGLVLCVAIVLLRRPLGRAALVLACMLVTASG